MMQVDLSKTELIRSESSMRPPDEAEVFALTVALLLTNDSAYGELGTVGLELTKEAVRTVAECIEYRTPSLSRDLGFGEELRQRLTELVGLRISVHGPVRSRTRKPT